MLRTPKSTKYKHTYHRYPVQKRGTKGYAHVGGLLEVKAKESHIFSPNLIEIIRRLLNKKVKDSGGSLDIRLFPSYSCSKKPLQSRMGKGKGRPDRFITPVYAGTPIISIHKRIEYHKLRSAMRRLKKRMPIIVKEKFYPDTTMELYTARNLKIKG